MTHRLSLKLLGGLAFEQDGLPLRGFRSRKEEALLAYLAVTGSTHPRASLAALLWGKWPQDRAMANLRRALTHLRGLVGEHLLITRREVSFEPHSDDWLDVELFERVALAPDASTVEEVEEAAALYRGDLLQGFYVKEASAFEEWLLRERERLHGLAVGLLRHLLDQRRERGEYDAAIAVARRLLTLDPWLEEAHRELMLLLALSGRRSEALAQYERCRLLLERELGLEPMEETTALYRRLVGGGISSLPLGKNVVADLPFVGRAREHATLVRWLEAAWGGEVRLALVEGEAGIGKSRLVEEVARYAVTEGAQFLHGRCYEFGSDLPYQPIVSALRHHLRGGEMAQRLAPTWRAELARLLPDLRAGDPHLPPPSRPSDETARQRLFEAVARYLLIAMEERPLLFFLDDLQWADAATLDLFHYLVRRLAGTPFWPIATYRPEDVALDHPLVRLRQGLSRDGLVRRLKIEPLTSEAVRRLTRALVGEEIAGTLASFLYRESEGNPFILGEVLTALRDEGALRQEGAHWLWREPRSRPIPLSVREVILLRVGRLGEEARELLSLAAVLGRRFDASLLAEVGAVDEAVVASALTAWEARRLVRPEIVSRRYDFSHDKIRAVVYQATSEERRRFFHRRVGEVMEGWPEPPYAQIAYHYERAGERERALHYLPLAAERASALYAHEEALRSFDRALALAKEPRLIARLRLGRGRALRFLARYEEARLSCEAVVEAGREDPSLRSLAAEAANELAALHLARLEYGEARHWSDEARRLTAAQSEEARAILLAGEVAWERGELEAAERSFRVALESYRALGDRGGVAAALERRGRLFAVQGRYEAAMRDYDEALRAYRSLGDRRREALSLRSLGKALWRQGDDEAARRAFSESLAISRTIGDREGEADGLNGLGVVHIVRGDYEATRRAWEASASLYRDLGLERRAAMVMHNLGIMYLDLGDYAAAEHHLRASLESSRASGSRRSEALDLGWLGKLAFVRGDYGRARLHLERALALDEEGASEEWLWHRAWLGMTLEALGEVAVAKQVLLQAVKRGEEHADALQVREALYALADIHLRLGEVQAALQAGRQALALARREGKAERLALCYALMGEIHARSCASSWAEVEFRRALVLIGEVVQRGVHRFSQALILRRYGAALLRWGREEEGRQRLERARHIFARLGAKGELARVETLLLESGLLPS